MSARRILNLRMYAAMYFQIGQLFFCLGLCSSTPYGQHKHTHTQIQHTPKEIIEKFCAEWAKIGKSGNANYDFV